MTKPTARPVMLISVVLAAAVTVRAADLEPIYFLHGASINLAAIRGAKTSASDNCITSSDLVCRPVHTQEMRFHSDYGAAWWMIELPQVFMPTATASRRTVWCESHKLLAYGTT